jgi:hypothetical protein
VAFRQALAVVLAAVLKSHVCRSSCEASHGVGSQDFSPSRHRSYAACDVDRSAEYVAVLANDVADDERGLRRLDRIAKASSSRRPTKVLRAASERRSEIVRAVIRVRLLRLGRSIVVAEAPY